MVRRPTPASVAWSPRRTSQLGGSSELRTWGGSGSPGGGLRQQAVGANRPDRVVAAGQTSRDREVAQCLVVDHETPIREHGAKESERDAALALG
jgi:hypothetical protein